ncbi:MAG: CDP-glycerol glycerophosphotransferase family protein [Eubacteriales bacterium]|nr:CDP-glycerol glycerophosphotransferase family protein [Eubacteriales bacterium]MDD3880730.1 CDP-glycerol glycerophosphotransferase family protein [Eubacteriales bacterium]MDD4511636.1 CDP-glycerol glycerophosphotransferase family protein [Eubacteriales bacterium]
MKKLIEKLSKLARCVLEALSLLVFTALGRLARLVIPSCKNIWLIAERGLEARDNSYHLFKYVTENHPEIRAVFVIKKGAPDEAKVKKIGETASRGSAKHRLMMGAARRLISTHIMGYTPDLGAYFRLDRLRIVPGIKIFLQHGITKDDMAFMRYPATRADLLVCAAKPEYDYIAENFGHKKDVVQLLGFCRFDALTRAPKSAERQILLMPTWREWLALHDGGSFTDTEYCKTYKALLKSKRLADLLEKYDYTLAFFPHHEMQRFIGSFSSEGRVRVLSESVADVQALLISSSVLITDYSSVFFDFAYMNKPEIFYQFDETEFRARQYKEGYFSYRRDAFGAVVAKEDELLSELEKILENKCETESVYTARADAFFGIRDCGNCERNYEAILKTEKHRE